MAGLPGRGRTADPRAGRRHRRRRERPRAAAPPVVARRSRGSGRGVRQTDREHRDVARRRGPVPGRGVHPPGTRRPAAGPGPGRGHPAGAQRHGRRHAVARRPDPQGGPAGPLRGQRRRRRRADPAEHPAGRRHGPAADLRVARVDVRGQHRPGPALVRTAAGRVGQAPGPGLAGGVQRAAGGDRRAAGRSPGRAGARREGPRPDLGVELGRGDRVTVGEHDPGAHRDGGARGGRSADRPAGAGRDDADRARAALPLRPRLYTTWPRTRCTRRCGTSWRRAS